MRFLFQILELAGLIGLELAELHAPAVVGLVGHTQLPADLGDPNPLAQKRLRLRELVDELLGRMPFPRHDFLPSQIRPSYEKYSHNKWTVLEGWPFAPHTPEADDRITRSPLSDCLSP